MATKLILIFIYAVLALLQVDGSTMPHKRSKFKLHQQLVAQSDTAHDACTHDLLASSGPGTSESAINHNHTPITYMPMLLTPEEVHQVQSFISNLMAKRTQGRCSTPPIPSQTCRPRVCREFKGSDDNNHADAENGMYMYIFFHVVEVRFHLMFA